MNSLFVLQLVCCMVSTMMMTLLACTGFLIRHRRRRFEVSRWLLCISMFMLAFHFVMQMRHGLRASGDDVGTVVNLLCYSPVALLFSYAIYNVECARAERKPFLWCGIGIYVLMLVAFFIGWSQTETLHIGNMLYVMIALFVIGIISAVVAIMRIVVKRRKVLEAQTGMDLVGFDRFAMSSFFVICGFALLMPIGMMYRPALFIIGPILLLSLFVFVLCFIAVGYNMNTISDIAELSVSLDDTYPLPDERVEEIEAALDRWRCSGGYRNNMASVVTLADSTGLPRNDLAVYFKRNVRTTFRAWLSDVRLDRAKQMLMENRNRSIDSISAECGFTSRVQMCRLFKARTGMGPDQWRQTL